MRLTHRHRCDHCGDRHLCRIPAWLPLEEVPADVEPAGTPHPASPPAGQWVAEWVQERAQARTGWTSFAALYDDYVTWVFDAGRHPVGQRRFAQSLVRLGIAHKRSNGSHYAVTLLPDSPSHRTPMVFSGQGDPP